MAAISTPPERVDWVDYAKGICIVMVVMMHSTLGVEAAAGHESWMHYFVAFAKPFREFRDEMEHAYVQRLLERHGGNVQAAAQAAGLDRTYIYRLLKKHEA